jgi:hypothetical protein
VEHLAPATINDLRMAEELLLLLDEGVLEEGWILGDRNYWSLQALAQRFGQKKGLSLLAPYQVQEKEQPCP